MAKKPLVHIIILNFNHRDELKLTIESFKNQDYKNAEIVVVDNNSSDDSVSWLQQHHPEVTLIENKENLGWSGGNNRGVQYAISQAADFVLLANNDIEFYDSGIVGQMVSDLVQFESNKIYSLGVRVNYFSDKSVCNNEGLIIYPKQEKRGNAFNLYRKKNSNNLGKNYAYVDAADGCFFMINTKLFVEIGLLKEELFLYSDEIEFSIRAWKKGYASVVNKRLTIYHKVGTSSNPRSALWYYYRTRNLGWLTRKYNPSFTFFLIYYKGVLKSMVINLMNREYKLKERLRIARAIVLGYCHGVIHRLGKYY